MSADKFRLVLAIVIVTLAVMYIAQQIEQDISRKHIIDDCTRRRSAMFAGDQRPRCESDYRQKTLD